MPDGTNIVALNRKPREIDRAALHPFLERLKAAAGDTPGNFVIVGIDDRLRDWRVVENGPDAVAHMVEAVEAMPGLNTYASIGLFKPRDQWKNPAGRGSEDDLIGTLANVQDFDAKHDPSTYKERLPLEPHVVVETSAGNFQTWTFLDKPYCAGEAKPVFQAMARSIGTDATFTCEHLFRLPGTWNWPTKKKIAAGRDPNPQPAKLVECQDQEPGVTLDDLRTALVTKYPDAFTAVIDRAQDDNAFDWNTPAVSPRYAIEDEYFERKLNESGDRSAIVAIVIERCRRNGWTPEEVFEKLTEIGGWALDRYDRGNDPHGTEADKRLRDDIERLYRKKPKDRYDDPAFREEMRRYVEEYDRQHPGEAERRAEREAEAERLREELKDKAKTEEPKDGAAGEEPSRFALVKPSTGKKLPRISYWDDTQMLPRDGATVVLYGDFGSHKTNTVLTLMLDAVFDKGARVVFAAGEGSHGLLTERIPAHCRARKVPEEELDEQFAVSRDVPLFANTADVREFIAQVKGFKPNLIVLDTLSTAIAGTDENSSQAAQFLTGNGPVGWLKRELTGATVILPAHEGKTQGRGIRGNSGYGGNTDAIIKCEADKDARVIRLTVEKMRDGPDGFSVWFKYEPEGVPVPERITEQEYDERLIAVGKAPKKPGKATTTKDAGEGRRLNVKLALVEAKADRFMAGLSHEQFAEKRITETNGERPPGDGQEARDWDTLVYDEKEALRKAVTSGKAWTVGLGSRSTSHTGPKAKPEWRWWYDPKKDQSAAADAGEIPT